jgi:hypothetical protein
VACVVLATLAALETTRLPGREVLHDPCRFV